MGFLFLFLLLAYICYVLKDYYQKLDLKNPFLSFTKLSKVLLLAEEPYPAIGKRLLFSNIRLKFNL